MRPVFTAHPTEATRRTGLLAHIRIAEELESNFPADRRSCDYVTLWNALKHIVVQASKSEKNALFHDNAARVYRIAT